MKYIFSITSILLGLFCLQTDAADLTFQNGLNSYEGASDTHLIGNPESARILNFGASPTLAASGTPAGGAKRLVLIQFTDLTGPEKILPGSVVQNATLELFKVKNYGSPEVYDRLSKLDRMLQVFRMLKPWKAGTGQGTQEDAGATFEHRDSNLTSPVSWGEANKITNGPSREVDYTRARPASALSDFGQPDVWLSWNVTEFVQQWLDDPQSNHGMLIMARTSDLGAAFESCDSLNQELRPRLLISY